jgi:4-amino-4-deoxy-L-arabinose transferase-like glycosyltransferase
MPFQSSWIQQVTLYKYRYVIGYTLLLVLTVFVLGVDIRTLPAGINEREMATAVTSSTVGSIQTLEWMVNAPFHIFQHVLIWLFGISKLSLVIPSLVFSALTIILFILTMRIWFKPNIAIITSIIAITNVAFINMARSGTPDIMLSFWTILLLFASAKLLMKQEKALHWKVLIAFAAAMLLYTPFGVYILAAFVTAGLFHPHIRSRVRKIKQHRILLLAIFTTLVAAPLAYAAVKQPKIIDTLTGLSQFIGAFHNPIDNLRTLFDYYANFLHGRLEGGRILPTFGVVTITLTILGFFQAVRDRYTARSYALLSWSLVAGIIALLVPREQSVVLMPVMLLLAIGIETLINDWYKLFPRNPYARIAGLIPLSILFIGAAYGNLNHYFLTMRYNTNPTYTYSLSAVKQALLTEGDRPVYLIVKPEQQAFYSLVQHSYPRTSVLTAPRDTTVQYTTLVLPGATNPYTQPPSQIITTYTKENGVALRAYRP